MIVGIGIDTVEIGRIRDSHQRHGDRFIERILLPAEIDYCLKHKDPAPSLAARFAAKEAISKAFGIGISAELGWLDMEVGPRDTGAPPPRAPEFWQEVQGALPPPPKAAPKGKASKK